MKICPNCGMENSDESLFCSSCGTDLETGEKRTKPNKGAMLPGIILAVALAVGSIGYGVMRKASYETYDAFEKLDVEFSGANGQGVVSYNYTGDEALTISSDKDKAQDLSNGDKVNITIKIGNMSEFAKDYGHVPEKTRKTYTVSGLKETCKTIAEIPQAAKDAMRASADTKMQKIVAYSHENYYWEDMADATYVGEYMLVSKTSANDDGDASLTTNKYALLYKTETTNIAYGNREDAYIGIVFEGIRVDENGEYEVEDLDTPGNAMTGGSWNNNYTKSLEEYKESNIDIFLDEYTAEINFE